MADHTIVLLQYNKDLGSRTYLTFPTEIKAMDALVKMYEHKLKELNPQVQHITYDISDLYNYLDSLTDLVALVFEPSSSKYVPHDRAYIKGKIYSVLRSQAP